MSRVDLSNVREKALQYWPQVLAVGGSIASIVSLVVAYLTSAGPNVFAVFLIVALTALWILLVVQEYRYARKASYSEVIKCLHSTVHRIRDALHQAHDMTEEHVVSVVEAVLADVATAFSLATRTRCRACVKVLALATDAPPNNETMPRRDRARYLTVGTFARDPGSVPTSAADRPVRLEDNSDFVDLFIDNDQPCFFENDLPARFQRGRYRNSHIPVGHDANVNPWPLAYRSSLTWPIRRFARQERAADLPDLIGFLCVDSGARNIFRKRFDFDTGALVADALYLFLKPYVMKEGERRVNDTTSHR